MGHWAGLSDREGVWRTCKYHRTEELTFTQHLALYQALYMLSHVVFTKMDVSSYSTIKAAETQKLGLEKGFPPPQRAELRLKRISVPRAPVLAVTSSLDLQQGGDRQDQSWNCWGHMAAREGARESPLSCGLVSFLSLCHHSTAEGTCELALLGHLRVLCLSQTQVCGLSGPERNMFEESLRKQSTHSRWMSVEWMGLLPSGNPVNRSGFTRSP